MTSTLPPLTDLDYKALFLDAVRMMAEIARAAGFDPNDPSVEPPDVMARVENMRLALSKAEKERDAALQRLADARAPVGGVNVEEVLSDPDRPWLFAPWVDVQARLDVVPVLAREVIRLREVVRFVDEQGAEAIDRVAREIVADKWNATGEFQRRSLAAEAERDELRALWNAEMAEHRATARECGDAHAEVAHLTAERDELRLTLAAERGLPEGAVSEGWAPSGGLLREWQKRYPDGTEAQVRADGRWWRGYRGELPSWPDRPGRRAQTIAEGPAGLKRAGMLAADAALSGEG